MTDGSTAPVGSPPAFTEDKDVGPEFLRNGHAGRWGAHYYFDYIVSGVVAIGIVLVVEDVWVARTDGLGEFTALLSAESTGVLAAVATIAGLAATWRFLRITPNEPPAAPPSSQRGAEPRQPPAVTSGR